MGCGRLISASKVGELGVKGEEKNKSSALEIHMCNQSIVQLMEGKQEWEWR